MSGNEYLLYPDETYVGDVYPYAVPKVDDSATECHSPAGSVWERVGEDDTDAQMLAEAILTITQATDNINDVTNATIPIDRLVPSGVGMTVETGVLVELWNKIMTADTGEFLTLRADLFEANSITVDKLKVGIADGAVITGALLRTSSSYKRVELSDYGLRAFNSNNDLVVEIQGEEATFTGSLFQTSAGATRTEMGQQGLRVLDEGTVKFQAHSNSSLAAMCYDTVKAGLRPLSSMVFGPHLFVDNSHVTMNGSSYTSIMGNKFTAPSSRVSIVFEFDNDCYYIYPAYPHYQLILRDEASGTEQAVWASSDLVAAHVQMWSIFPHFMANEIVSLTPGRTYSIRLQAKLMGTPEDTTNARKNFGYARACLIPC